MGLEEQLRLAVETAVRFADDGEEVSGVVPAEPASGERVYLCVYSRGESQRWLALDAGGSPVDDRRLVRDAVSIAAMCELAEETAAGGDLDELRSQLVALRMTENPPGIDEAEEAVLALQGVIGTSPRVATPMYLDDVGIATRRLEQALGEDGRSPFAEAMKHSVHAVEAFADDVEANYKRELA